MNLKQIKQEIHSELKKSMETARTELNKNITVMEVSPNILKKNIPEFAKYSNKELTSLITSIFEVFKQTSSIAKPFTNDTYDKYYKAETNKLTVPLYLRSSSSFLIIATSFDSLRNILTKISDSDKFKNTPIGIVRGKNRSRLDIGHTAQFGSPNEEVREARNTVLGSAIMSLVVGHNIGSINKAGRSALTQLSKIHAPYRVNMSKTRLVGRLSGKFSFVYTVPQSMETNGELAKGEKKVLRFVEKFLLGIKSSPSIDEMLLEDLDAAFYGKKAKNRRYNATLNGVISGSTTIKAKSASVSFKGVNKRFSDALALRSLINRNLHDQIKKNMGKGENMEILNYRTGRFAKSAEVTSVTQGKSGMFSFYYTYMRSPYDTFLPGGRLYKVGRNPKNIIGKSIRQLAMQVISDKFKTKTVLR